VTFEQAVTGTQGPVGLSFHPGKQGMETKHRSQVDCDDPRRFTGSIDLDRALSAAQPNSNRWDYGIGFRVAGGREVAIWLEVHPASAGEVDVVLRKYAWLVAWLKTHSPNLDVLTRRPGKVRRFFWLATRAGVNIRPGSLHARRLQSTGFDLPRRSIKLI
jgi:hypothetical protein